MREKVLGISVDILSRGETLGWIEKFIKSPGKTPALVATAYSEFFVLAQKDLEFAKTLKQASLVTPDGVSVLAAVYYTKEAKGKSVLGKLVLGLKTGLKILTGELGETVTGVWMFEELAKMASEKGWKIFLLGGWNNVSQQATEILLKRFPDLRIMNDPGEDVVGKSEEDNKRIVEKIKRYKPDILFVQYRPVQQEKWIMANRENLKVSVAMGIGGTLNEFVGELKLAPVWMQAMGLKWLWRLIQEPHRWRRMIDAVIVFPWLVFRESLERNN